MIKLVWAVTFVALGLLSFACGPKSRSTNQTARSLDTLTMTIAGTKVALEVAKDRETLSKGLMFRDSLAPNTGMLFIFEREGMYSFWMKNTRIPLSIAFINSQGRIVGLDEMQPYDTVTMHMPFEPYIFAIEMDSGWFPQKGVKQGDTLTMPQLP